MKAGDLYGYATVYFESHGCVANTYHEHVYPLSEETENGFKLQGTNEVYLKPGKVNVLEPDPRRGQRDMTAYIMIYEVDKTNEEILAILKPRIEENLQMRVKLYELLAKNAKEMLDACNQGKSEHTCPPEWKNA